MSKALLRLIADIDNAICCFSWPLTLLWSHWRLHKVRQSILTRVRSVTILLCVSVICLTMLSAKVWLVLNDRICYKVGYKLCERFQGPGPVYRILFLLFVYFFVISLLMVGVENTKSWRATFHNHFWTFKSVVLLIFLVSAVFIPRTLYTGEVWHFFGLNAAFAFIVLQFIIIIDTVHVFNARVVSWMEDFDDCYAKYFFFMLWLPTSILYLVSIYGTVVLYKMYGSRTECSSNMFFISFHIYMCVAATFISIHPVVQEAKPKSGLLQSSVTTAYSTYILWLALAEQPDDLCNPAREYLFPADPSRNEQILLSLTITFFTLFIFSTRIVSPPQYGKVGKETLDISYESIMEDEEFIRNLPQLPSIIEDDELRGVEYSYSFFYFTISISSLYIMMTITNWYRPEEEENLTVKLIAGWGAIWIKLCSGIFCVFLYIWFLAAPVIFPNSYRELVFYDLMFAA